jgi:hypothetical protein
MFGELKILTEVQFRIQFEALFSVSKHATAITYGTHI